MIRNLERFGHPIHVMGKASKLTSRDVPAGILTFDYGGEPLDILNQPNDSDVTVVSFHAARGPRTTELPIFSGTRLAAGIDCNVISVADPSLSRESILLGWHIGNNRQPLQRDLPEFLAQLLDSQGAKHVIFVGASGGGFASLYYSALFPGSLAFPLNPQTSIAEYLPSQVRRYTTACFGVESIDDLPAWPVTDLTDFYRSGHGNVVAYYQNVGDDLHITRHLPPFLEATAGGGRVLTRLIDDGPGHVIVHTTAIREVLTAAVDAPGQWLDSLPSLGFDPMVTPSTVSAHRRQWEANQATTARVE